MKSTQWTVALVVLVVLVFGITFFANYIGDSGTNNSGPAVAPGNFTQLAFPIRSLPTEGGRYAFILERGHEGYADFWFYNPNDSAVPVGLNRVACRCSSVEVWLMPRSILTERAAEAAGLCAEGQGISGPLAVLTRMAATENAGRTTALESRAEHNTLHHAPVEIAPGAVGWIRLKWKNNLLGRQKLDAQLWFHHASLGPTVVLEAWAYFQEPFTIGTSPREVVLPDVSVDRLEQSPLTEVLYAWSHTRRTLDLRAVSAALGQRQADDAFVVGKPEPASSEEIAQLERTLGATDDDAPIRSAYRIPYTVYSRSPRGKVPFDQGLFMRRIQITLADEDLDKQEVRVQGAIQGDIHIEGPRTKLNIDLGTFSAADGTLDSVRTLTTTVPGLQLEVDPDRMARFVKVALDGPHATADGGRSWTLRVKVEPKKILGRFPRLDDPELQDTAVYVRPVGGKGRALRIPLHGLATP